MNNTRKAILSIFVALLLAVPIIPLAVSGFGIPAGADADDWYVSVQGVAHTDTYTLYPYFWDFTEEPDERVYDPHSITVGLSKFGELINSRENAPGNFIGNLGLQYGEDNSGRIPSHPHGVLA